MRGLVTPPRRKALTQGMIFSAATAEDFPDMPVSGLIVTARCDIAQGRVATFHYIPVVRLCDWLTIAGLPLLKERIAEGAYKSLRGALRRAGHPETALELGALTEVMDAFFPEVKEYKSARANFISQAGRIEKSEPITTLGEMLDHFPGDLSTLVNEVANNKLTGLFFLERIEPGGDDSGYVALLREINKLPRAIATFIENGFDKEQFQKICELHPQALSLFSLRIHDYCAPQSQVASPYIEQLMQAFANLFARIGVEDLKKEYVDGLLARQAGAGVQI